ncbi:hypothetical protein FSP39_001646 [Pinctada imbricata]|uniref:Integrase catalytic domain-containing protein n=1 Tax=Pinctada imbricata TaxID=66713 RepID=A0AA88XCB1_PINIB|nr:hypothetical protein FSP39_001646 [Pinctada imbricata]
MTDQAKTQGSQEGLPQPTSELGVRYVVPTSKAKELYDSRTRGFRGRISDLQNELEQHIYLLSSTEEIDAKTDIHDYLQGIYKQYLTACGSFSDFLRRHRTEESERELHDHQAAMDIVCEKVNSAIKGFCQPDSDQIQDTVPVVTVKEEKVQKETGSVKQRSRDGSAKTHGSFLSQVARAEGARVKLQYTAKLNSILKQKALAEAENLIKSADIEAKINELKAEEEVNIAEAEVKVYQEQDGSQVDSDTSVDQNVIQQRTNEFIQEQNTLLNDRHVIPTFGFMPSANSGGTEYIRPPPVRNGNNVQPTYMYPSDVNNNLPYTCTVPQVDRNSAAGMMDIVTYLTKQNFMPQRIQKFNDQCETYLSWKLTFKEVMTEIKATPLEELELMISYLGRVSKLEVTSIKASNAGDPVRGLKKAWERLDETYGSPEKVEHALKRKLLNVVKTPISYKTKSRLYEVSDVLNEILSVKMMPNYAQVFSYMDTSLGVQPVVNKLPLGIRNKWRDRGLKYKKDTGNVFPPFTYFCDFIREMAAAMNDPGFEFTMADQTEGFQGGSGPRAQPRNSGIVAQKTNLEHVEGNGDKTSANDTRCLIHNTSHKLENCRAFISMTHAKKKELIRKNGYCYKCLDGKHLSKDCKATVRCEKCSSTKHPTVMHFDSIPTQSKEENGGEKVETKCTHLCGRFAGKSCAKIILINVCHKDSRHQPTQIYAILDEQSNQTLACTNLFDTYDPNAPEESYPLSTCSGEVMTEGRKSYGFVISSLDGKTVLDLPYVIECDSIPSNRNEIPTPEVADSYEHLQDISDFIPPLNDDAPISILIGRDLLCVHQVMDQKVGLSPHEPFAQRLNLGWVIIGEACLDKHQKHSKVNVLKTLAIPESGKQLCASVFYPCEYNIQLTSNDTIFQRTQNDNKVAMSIEDKEFLALMDREMVKGQDGHWMAPLPFKKGRSRLPNNRSQALDRAKTLDGSLDRNSVKSKHFTTFMGGLITAGHAERAPNLSPLEECWYLPLFGVYHPQKKDRIRGVFDSSAIFNGMSLNKVLMTGPDLMNNLQGVLLRFRCGQIAIMADIELMFYCFRVHPDHYKYLRFMWHEDNDITKPLVDYHMKVHVFGNSPSPAVATYGLRKTAREAESTYGSDTRAFVERNFYVDDALSSHNSPQEAIDLLQRTKDALWKFGRLRLHKIVSNSEDVLSAFDSNDLAKDVRDVDLETQELPNQRSLGMRWSLEGDYFTFKVSLEDKPFTRRGVLSSINSLFDPMGFVAPVTIAGKAILREAMCSGQDWDEPLTQAFHDKWQKWRDSLQHLQTLRIPRTYCHLPLMEASEKDLLIFCDASEAAISAVSYVRLTGKDGKQCMGFMLGKARLAPKHGHTVPRLELCAAVLGTELYTTITRESDIVFDRVKFFTDSRVVLGYIHNQTKRFFTYVANRVERIRSCSQPQDWNYIPSKLNPADEGTRSVPAQDMKTSLWLNGPTNILCDEIDSKHEFPLIEPDSEVRILKTEITDKLSTDDSNRLGSNRFLRFFTWQGLLYGMSALRHLVSVKFKKGTQCEPKSREAFKAAEELVISTVQYEAFPREIDSLRKGTPLPRDSTIRTLDPFLDDKGLLRVGGRLKHSGLPPLEINPVIVPKKHHIGYLLIKHFHACVSHQGRLITEGAIRSGGYWIVRGRRCIQSFVNNCVQCLKLRGKQQTPKMADLPKDRLEPAPPFACIGIDVFGPWNVIARKTRGGLAHYKRWAVIFTCLVIRAIHIEVIHEMSSSSFLNALRRLIALRGPVKLVRSDCGTNFVGAAKDLSADVIAIDSPEIKDYLTKQGITWRFNPPHASHMGGVWESLIGVSRRVLNSLLCDNKQLTDEVLATLMAEVCQIVNARPIAGIPSDPYSPMPLSPAMILTLKSDHSVDSFTLEDFTTRDLYKSQWRCVQQLANCFWKRWKNEFLSQLQLRKKWQDDNRDFCEGDIVLLRDKTLHRSEWPMGIITRVMPSKDSRVRKVDVCVGKDKKVYTRPSCELVLLVPKEG